MTLKNIFTEIPDGWKEHKRAATAPLGCVWITNGKSVFDPEYKQALLIKDSELFESREIKLVGASE